MVLADVIVVLVVVGEKGVIVFVVVVRVWTEILGLEVRALFVVEVVVMRLALEIAFVDPVELVGEVVVLGLVVVVRVVDVVLGVVVTIVAVGVAVLLLLELAVGMNFVVAVDVIGFVVTGLISEVVPSSLSGVVVSRVVLPLKPTE